MKMDAILMTCYRQLVDKHPDRTNFSEEEIEAELEVFFNGIVENSSDIIEQNNRNMLRAQRVCKGQILYSIYFDKKFIIRRVIVTTQDYNYIHGLGYRRGRSKLFLRNQDFGRTWFFSKDEALLKKYELDSMTRKDNPAYYKYEED